MGGLASSPLYSSFFILCEPLRCARPLEKGTGMVSWWQLQPHNASLLSLLDGTGLCFEQFAVDTDTL
jgi:hypothetical protein